MAISNVATVIQALDVGLEIVDYFRKERSTQARTVRSLDWAILTLGLPFITTRSFICYSARSLSLAPLWYNTKGKPFSERLYKLVETIVKAVSRPFALIAYECASLVGIVHPSLGGVLFGDVCSIFGYPWSDDPLIQIAAELEKAPEIARDIRGKNQAPIMPFQTTEEEQAFLNDLRAKGVNKVLCPISGRFIRHPVHHKEQHALIVEKESLDQARTNHQKHILIGNEIFPLESFEEDSSSVEALVQEVLYVQFRKLYACTRTENCC
jgi:hypothetical protein